MLTIGLSVLRSQFPHLYSACRAPIPNLLPIYAGLVGSQCFRNISSHRSRFFFPVGHDSLNNFKVPCLIYLVSGRTVSVPAVEGEGHEELTFCGSVHDVVSHVREADILALDASLV